MDTSARVQDDGAPNISTIGEELMITGNVSSTGELHINGKIQGDVQCIALVLGENAQLDGDVVAEDVIVRGRLTGSVRALRVMLQSQSHVEGNKSLSIEQGTYFEGESRPSEDPLSASSAVPKGNGSLDARNQCGSVKGFIRSLPESRNA
jgi:cytoskeletal protein CcmA (bactofilin family)